MAKNTKNAGGSKEVMGLKLELSPVFTRWQVHCQKCGAVFYVDTESASTGEEILELEDIHLLI